MKETVLGAALAVFLCRVGGCERALQAVGAAVGQVAHGHLADRRHDAELLVIAQVLA